MSSLPKTMATIGPQQNQKKLYTIQNVLIRATQKFTLC